MPKLTKRDDAISICDPKLVDELELELQKEIKLKSEVEELIIKSQSPSDTVQNPEAGNAPHLQEDTSEFVNTVLAANEFDKFRTMLYKLQTDGKIEAVTSEETDILSKMLNWIAGWASAKSDLSGQSVEVNKDGNIVVKDLEDDIPVEMYRPLSGAESLKDANDYIIAQKTVEGIYKAYSLFGAVCNNIMSDPDLGTNERISKLKNLLGEFKSMLTPDTLITLSEAEKAVADTQKSDTVLTLPIEQMNEKEEGGTDRAVKALNDTVDKLMALITQLTNGRSASDTPVKNKIDAAEDVYVTMPIVKSIQEKIERASTLNSVERKSAFQEIVNTVAQDLINLDKSLEPVNQTNQSNDLATFKSEVVSEVNNLLGSQLGLVSKQIEQLSSQMASMKLGNQPVRIENIRPAPITKSLVPNAQIVSKSTIEQKKNGSTIKDIIQSTVLNPALYGQQ